MHYTCRARARGRLDSNSRPAGAFARQPVANAHAHVYYSIIAEVVTSSRVVRTCCAIGNSNARKNRSKDLDLTF